MTRSCSKHRVRQPRILHGIKLRMPDSDMSNFPWIARTLRYIDAKGESHAIGQADIVSLPGPLVVLGEPGSGKSVLLSMVADTNGLTLITAKQLLRRTSLANDGKPLVIDALDEVATAQESDAVHRVLEKLDTLGRPPFILSCRAADWQGAIASQDIAADYVRAPTVLSIAPLSRVDAAGFLSTRLPAPKSQELIDHLEQRSLAGLYHNPLTLSLLAKIADGPDPVPDTRTRLFETACDLLWKELATQHEGSALSKLTRNQAILAAGACCAVQILTGADALSMRGAAQVADGDRAISIVEQLPHGAHARAVLNSRLFVPVGEQRFAPLHRVIGEYLGAQWIAQLLVEGRSDRRVFSMLRLNETVPASLRGIHAWIAHFSPMAAAEVIAKDPYGVLRYGDVSDLTTDQARMLLAALSRLAGVDPYFRSGDWGQLGARSLARPELKVALEHILDNSTNFHLRKLVLECVAGSDVAGEMAPRLRALMMNADATFAERSEAADALLSIVPASEWPEIIGKLRVEPFEDATRLALETLTNCDLDAFTDAEIAETILAFLGYLFSPADRSKAWTWQTVGSMSLFSRKVPDARLASILDLLSEYNLIDSDHDDWERRYELSNFVSRGIRHVLRLGPVKPDRVWNWLKLLDTYHGRSRDDHLKLEAIFRDDSGLRRSIQRYALAHDTSEDTLWMRSWRLHHVLNALSMTTDDAVEMLEEVAARNERTERDDQDWQDLVQIARSRDGLTPEVTAVARRYARGDKELLAFLRKAARPTVNKWEKQSLAKERKRAKEKQSIWGKHRAEFGENEALLRSADLRWIVPAAQSYLGLYRDSNREQAPIDRVREWLGDDLAAAAAAGFEAALHRTDLPSPTDVAVDFTKRRRWNMVYPVLAGLAERIHRGIELAGVPRDALLLAWLTIHHESYLPDHLKLEKIERLLEDALAPDPVAFASDWRLLVETQLDEKIAHVWGLYRFMRSDTLRPLAVGLAEDWLIRYPALGVETAVELIDCLVGAGRHELLGQLWKGRVESASDDEQRLLWLSAAFVADFDGSREALEAFTETHPNLIWAVRSRMGREDSTRQYNASVAQIAWLIETFRSHWPVASRPDSVTMGNDNRWDATDFLRHLINALGSDSSIEAGEALIALRDAPEDGYTDAIRHSAAQQRRARDEAAFEPVSAERLQSVACNAPPQSIDDLQAALCESLDTVQQRLRGGETNPLDAFYESTGRPKGENYCRDRIVEWLGHALPPSVTMATEVRMPNDKRSDIAFQCNGALVPVEIKPQWNSTVWDAAIDQLDALYTKEWRALGRGIYVALWFGAVEARDKRLTTPPAGIARPTEAKSFRDLLHDRIPEARRGQLAIVVLDLAR